MWAVNDKNGKFAGFVPENTKLPRKYKPFGEVIGDYYLVSAKRKIEEKQHSQYCEQIPEYCHTANDRNRIHKQCDRAK